MKTKLAVLAAIVALAAVAGGAEAKGCLKGAVVGGVAGHVAGHHGLVGAAAGCAIGHHEAKKKAAKEQADLANRNAAAPAAPAPTVETVPRK